MLTRSSLGAVVAFCLVLVAVCYANSLPNPFIQDDKLIILGNESIRQIAPLRFLAEPYWPKYRIGGAYRPLTILTFSGDYAIWGRWAPGFRLTNLLLHALNGFLVFLLARALLQSASAGLAAAGVYLVHPVHTEAVVGIVGRSELLAAGLFFTAWLLFRGGWTGSSAFVFFLSLLSKEHAIMFPVIAALDVVLFDGGVKKLVVTWRRFAVLAATAAAYLGLRFYALGELGVRASDQYLWGSLSPLQRWITSGRVFLRYFRLILAPVDVAGVYEFNSIHVAALTDWDAWLGLALIAASILLAVYLRKNRPVISFAILFFFICLVPVSNWFTPISTMMAERFLYTPSFAAALLAGVVWSKIRSARIRQVAGAAVLIGAVPLCMSHNLIWRNDFRFYSNMVRVLPDNLSGRIGYALAFQTMGRFDEAREQYEAALRIAPENPTALSSYASFIVLTTHDCGPALPLLNRALTAQSNFWQAFWVLGNCSALNGQMEMADDFYRRASENALALDEWLYYDWGLALEALGRKAAAIDTYRRGATIMPENEDIRRRLSALAP